MKSSSSPAFLFIVILTAISIVMTTLIKVVVNVSKLIVLATGYGAIMPTSVKITTAVSLVTMVLAEVSWLQYIS